LQIQYLLLVHLKLQRQLSYTLQTKSIQIR
jgi:hypothetical protein